MVKSPLMDCSDVTFLGFLTFPVFSQKKKNQNPEISGQQMEIWETGKHHPCGPLMDSSHILVGISFLNGMVGIQYLVTLLVVPCSRHPLQLNGGMQYFTSVFTTRCLNGLHEICYKVGKSN